MIKLLKCEFMKTRRCYVFLTALVICAMCLCWSFYGEITEDRLRLGWMMNLYQYPLINAIFLPLLSIVTASRLCGIEHKGLMLKELCSMEKKGRIFDAKLLYGLGIMVICVVVMWAAEIIYGKFIGYYGEFPQNLYLLYLIFTLVPTMVIYVFQHTLSLVFKNQAVSFFVGIIGEFAGIFSMFLPSIPNLRRALLWGYYGVLQFVGLYGWTKETRYENAYFEIMPIDWTFFVVLIAAGMVIYLAGKKIFCSREV